MSDEENIAYCGLYCKDCYNYTGTIADLARDLRKELRRIHFDKTAAGLAAFSFFKEFENYETCYKVLGSMVKLRCRRICRDGGGPPFCKIRKCCQKEELTGCWECSEFESCEKLDFHRPFHGVAHLKNLRRLQKKDPEVFVKGQRDWYIEGNK
ncbi:DUF3795 domain-containing protein [candidate division KSB1 bacterium]|nr:DUF3795 domain-containing protein [candidate division KSB1 bacterium]